MEIDLETIIRSEPDAVVPGVRQHSAVPIRVVDGWQQEMWIFEPELQPESPHPALLFFHGGGFAVGHPNSGRDLAQYLALRCGMTTFSASYRLARPHHPTYPKPIEDVAAAWNWVQTYAADWNVDPERLATGGASAGACLSTLSLTKGLLPGVKAHICFWGPIDLIARWYDNGEKPGAERILLGTNYQANPALYHQASALTHVKPGLPPAAFIYGNQDKVVHPRQGRLGEAAWKQCGSHAELHYFDNIGHGIEGDNTASMVQVIERAASFLEEQLIGQ
ncbi:alpha/beta hydrolase [Coraliomargarita parva]|uniref:alpha/beta hydrolase n=1 Tax=Coraliomargarita parva TaxID=3014050 RepID=UPI0022B4F24D|nr:alpha/beta hydrolase [Coraliomargarita parva]